MVPKLVSVFINTGLTPCFVDVSICYTPLLDIQMTKVYIGTYIYNGEQAWRRPYLSDRYQILAQLSETQGQWLLNNAPGWRFWRDEFRRRHYHIYSDVPISPGRLTMAALLFDQETPSHVPLGEEALWAGVFNH